MKLQYTILKEDYKNAGKASSQIKQVLKELSIPADLLRNIAVATYEAEINMIIHSEGGMIQLEIIDNKIRITFADTGPGIEDIEKALSPGFSTANETAREFGFGAGMGLPNIQRVSHDFHIESSKAGTTIIIQFEVNNE